MFSYTVIDNVGDSLPNYLMQNDNRKQIDFLQQIIDFRKETILTSLTAAATNAITTTVSSVQETNGICDIYVRT